MTKKSKNNSIDQALDLLLDKDTDTTTLFVSDPSTTPLKTANSYDSEQEELARAENR